MIGLITNSDKGLPIQVRNDSEIISVRDGKVSIGIDATSAVLLSWDISNKSEDRMPACLVSSRAARITSSTIWYVIICALFTVAL
jgi:hypothetical protein